MARWRNLSQADLAALGKPVEIPFSPDVIERMRGDEPEPEPDYPMWEARHHRHHRAGGVPRRARLVVLPRIVRIGHHTVYALSYYYTNAPDRIVAEQRRRALETPPKEY